MSFQHSARIGARAMFPLNFSCRTFFIKAAQNGTAFAIDVDGSQYSITVKHSIESIDPSSDRFELTWLFKKQWHSLNGRNWP
jgi:hypothetical protein